MTNTKPDRFGETIDAVIDSTRFRRNYDPVRADGTQHEGDGGGSEGGGA